MKKDDTRRDSAALGQPAPSEGAALVAVSALMEERRRFEGWIAALDARRASTPDHVFQRVHQDYTTRLEAVIVQLTSHADGLRRELESLTSRLDALTAEHQVAQDERAEAELRAHVGELSGEDWSRSAASSDATLLDLSARRTEVEQELLRTRELLDSTARPPARAEVAAPLPKPAVAEPRVSRQAPAIDVSAAAPPSADVPPLMELSAQIIAAEQQLLDIEERPTRASAALGAMPEPAEPVPPPPAEMASASAAPPPAAPPPARPRRSTGFDELAFLSSVVDTPAGTFDAAPVDEPDENARLEKFARHSREDRIINLSEGSTPLGSPIIEREGNPPLSEAAGTSAMRRDSSADGVKSLKCGECAAMNYPTEWYCERCGAELASL